MSDTRQTPAEDRPDGDGTTEVSRRELLGKSAAAGACLLAAGAAGAVLTSCNPSSGETVEVELTAVEELSSTPEMINFETEGGESGMVYAYRGDDGPVVLSNICTHQECRVGWNSEDGVFECPCHGSLFEKNGQTIQGPAPEPLRSYITEVRDGTLYIQY